MATLDRRDLWKQCTEIVNCGLAKTSHDMGRTVLGHHFRSRAVLLFCAPVPKEVLALRWNSTPWSGKFRWLVSSNRDSTARKIAVRPASDSRRYRAPHREGKTAQRRPLPRRDPRPVRRKSCRRNRAETDAPSRLPISCPRLFALQFRRGKWHILPDR